MFRFAYLDVKSVNTLAAVVNWDIYLKMDYVKLVIMYVHHVKKIDQSAVLALVDFYLKGKLVFKAAKLIALVVMILARNVKMAITY